MEELNTILNMFENWNYSGSNDNAMVMVTRPFLKAFCNQVNDKGFLSRAELVLGNVKLTALLFDLPFPYRIYCYQIYLIPIRYNNVNFDPMIIEYSMFPEASSEEQVYKMSQLKAFT